MYHFQGKQNATSEKKKHLPLESTAVPIILNVNNKAVHTEELYK